MVPDHVDMLPKVILCCLDRYLMTFEERVPLWVMVGLSRIAS